MPGRGRFAAVTPGALNKMAEDTVPGTPWGNAVRGGIWRTTCCGVMLRTWPWDRTWRQMIVCWKEVTQWMVPCRSKPHIPRLFGPTNFQSDHHGALCWPVESMIGWTQHSNKCPLPHEIAVDSSFLMNVHQLLFEIHMSCSVGMLCLVGHTLQATLSFVMLALIHQSHLGDWQPRTLYRLRKRGTDAQHLTPIHTCYEYDQANGQ